MMVGRFLLVSLLFLLTAAPAHGGWRLETVRKTTSTDISFVGTGCITQSTREVVLPQAASSVDVITPDIGTDLFDAGNTEPIATIRSLDSSPKKVTWIASGAGRSCAEENAAARWETAIVLLKVEYTIRKRVLTRGSVIRRVDAICRENFAKESAFERTNPSDIRTYTGIARIVRDTIRRLPATKTISTDRQKQFTRFRSGLDRAQKALDRAAVAARAGDRGAESSALATGYQAAFDAQTAARSYGLRVCGKP